ncbi:hypothetical protein [Noviherbaspirillum galbum]|uniref:Uncharacterized protein n=1 Tax=Noviherbaspirillum galbum TaxID=2709383 RepID=A0A6B3SZQ5_9BURK|nr:hypothetical protein [Noviherbaspirillum galbum]NEX64409.1 hypothetical protein [Noviherbaspirillum galbum]
MNAILAALYESLSELFFQAVFRLFDLASSLFWGLTGVLRAGKREWAAMCDRHAFQQACRVMRPVQVVPRRQARLDWRR